MNHDEDIVKTRQVLAEPVVSRSSHHDHEAFIELPKIENHELVDRKSVNSNKSTHETSISKPRSSPVSPSKSNLSVS